MNFWKWIRRLFSVEKLLIDVQLRDVHKTFITNAEGISISDIQVIELHARSKSGKEPKHTTWRVYPKHLATLRKSKNENAILVIPRGMLGKCSVIVVAEVGRVLFIERFDIKISPSQAVRLKLEVKSIENK
jgi:hypothetical protein